MRSKADIEARQVNRPELLISLQLAFPPMCVVAIGIEDPLRINSKPRAHVLIAELSMVFCDA
jgi:hypothetical protein